jgi:hypothetical protein
VAVAAGVSETTGCAATLGGGVYAGCAADAVGDTSVTPLLIGFLLSFAQPVTITNDAVNTKAAIAFLTAKPPYAFNDKMD